MSSWRAAAQPGGLLDGGGSSDGGTNNDDDDGNAGNNDWVKGAGRRPACVELLGDREKVRVLPQDLATP